MVTFLFRAVTHPSAVWMLEGCFIIRPIIADSANRTELTCNAVPLPIQIERIVRGVTANPDVALRSVGTAADAVGRANQ